MNELYEHYFGDVHTSMGKSRIVSAIYQNRINRIELKGLVAIFSEKGLLNDEPFNRKEDKNQWNAEYLLTLKSRFMAGVFSEAYLFHLAEVSEYLHAKRTRTIIAVAAAIVAAVIAIVIIAVMANG